MHAERLIRQRFTELLEKAEAIEQKKQVSSASYTEVVPSELVYEWSTSVLNLLQRIESENGEHYLAFRRRLEKFHGYHYEFRNCYGVLRAAKEDYEGGYLFKVRALVEAEVFEDALEQAESLLRANHKDPACVVAGVVLETTLKSLCTRETISLGNAESMNVELCKAGVYNMAMQKQVTAWVARRNNAAHGNWSAYNHADVDDLIKGVRRFIAEHT
jgi:hypothetical protein